MAGLGTPAPRASATLIAVLAALVAVAIAVPGVASADPNHSVSLSCSPSTVDAGEASNCLAVVTPKGSAPVATGEVGFFITGWTEFFDLGEEACELEPIGGGSASCSLSITGYAEGEENVIAHYPASLLEEFDSDNSEVTVRGGSLRVFCDDALLVRGEQTECRAYVPTEPGASPATGSVEFRSANRFSSPEPGEVEPECELAPVDEGASCSVTFITAATFSDEYAVLGEYEGDGIYAADLGTAFVTALETHQTEVEASCDRHEPFLSTPTECTVTVTSIWPLTGSAPFGNVTFDQESPSAGAFVGPDFCNPEPIAVRQSSCKVVYRPDVLGLQALKATYHGFVQYDPGEDSVDLDVKKGRVTGINLACEAGRVGVARKCTATVRDVEGKPAIAPVGSVSFSAAGGTATFSSTPCKLVALPAEPGASRCEVTYTPSAQGSLVIRAEYEGEGSIHRPSKAQTSVQVLPFISL